MDRAVDRQNWVLDSGGRDNQIEQDDNLDWQQGEMHHMFAVGDLGHTALGRKMKATQLANFWSYSQSRYRATGLHYEVHGRTTLMQRSLFFHPAWHPAGRGAKVPTTRLRWQASSPLHPYRPYNFYQWMKWNR